MINPESRTREWIESLRTQYPHIKDASLLEKSIRAFSLLESLVRSGCPFVFKGGTALMLHLGSSRRLSIDIDIVCKPGTNVWDYLERYAGEYGFTGVKEVSRKARTNVPKSHAAYEYRVSYPAGYSSGEILLDVLYEDIDYSRVLTLPIESPLLKTDGDPVLVQVPSLEDILGDKLTAFAPHTTGIPFFKGDKPFSMEIMKQLFDVSSILDRIDTLETVSRTFHKFVPIELGYRGLDTLSAKDVLKDAYDTAMNICLYGALNEQEYNYLTDGAHRVNGFILIENYTMERAVRDAAKVAYLARLIQTGTNEVRHYAKDADAALGTAFIEDPALNKLNRLKKVNTEAFFYCLQQEQLK
jgi:predicted nucleotidyltransferase component of viral defense system